MIRTYHWRHDCGVQYSYAIHPGHTHHISHSDHYSATQSYEAAPVFVPSIHLDGSPLLALPFYWLLFGALCALLAWVVTR